MRSLKLKKIKDKTMKNINKYLCLSLVCTLLISCSEEFVTIEPEGLATSEVFYSTLEGIEQGVTGTYASLNACPANLHNMDMMYLVWGSIASDEAEAGGEQGGNDFIDIQDVDKGTTKTIEPKSLSDNFWGYTYKSILRSNIAISGIQSFKSNNADIDEATKKTLAYREGEMIFINAFSHFKLMQVYGGIPIVDHELGSSEYAMSRNSIAEVLHYVQEQLIKAIDLLPLKSENGISNKGRASKGAAQALLAKAYLYEASYAKNYSGDDRFKGCTNTYDKALTYAEAVINSNEYYLFGINGETYDTYWSQNNSPIYSNGTPGYRYAFTVDAEDKLQSENVFEIESINDQLAYMISRGTYLNVYTAVRNVNSSTLGWGFNCPTDDMYNAYENGDLRREVTCGKTGDKIFVGANPKGTDWAWGKMDCFASPTNMIGRKFEASPAQYWSIRQDGSGPTNFPYIRYADVILMAAEAAVETGNSSKALTYVNMIRKRARNGASTGAPADLTSVNLDNVINERHLELALEGHRFFDLVRWKKQDLLTDHQLQKYLGGVAQSNPVLCQFASPKNDFFPIPQTEIENTNGSLVQYPGW
jgi:hypothetical protein